ncbi:hypothetical protein HS1genome_0373 [Sulfodiicoccus acidiphilus]|uniref:DNA-binding protein n=1 Tax=Sulfodiicoccus acidiphilus TaxID=1670455 RepID=A0A348B1D2_9CREN|nr:OB-fold domain-containing protein [Sulfodiicoccus acidiphilus]BBD71984.1 hypothetical protein HS1genome_0373 [Sulfodiicoccus acidiphilus]GGT91935.1 hypothetical protein GCM10007116_07110 [Sulfodiicoccus acidiphilus]
MAWTLNSLKLEYTKSMEEGSLPFLECGKCGHRFYYPRVTCPSCGSSVLEIRRSSGRGKVFSYTWFRTKDGRDYVYAVVEMEEGFRVYGNVEGKVDFDSPVSAEFRKVGDGVVPIFVSLNGEG